MSAATATAPQATMPGSFVKVDTELYFGDGPQEGFIGKPYWAELDQKIKFERTLGRGYLKMGPDRQKQAMVNALQKAGLTAAQWDKLVERSARPFYTITDADDGGGEIIIPEHVFKAFIRSAMDEAPKSMWGNMKDVSHVHGALRVADGCFRTGKTIADVLTYNRRVKMEESNMRNNATDLFINDFNAVGTLLIDEYYISLADFRRLVEFGGRMKGIGSARKMGFGRFTVAKWDEV
jgi:hypothetical protein